jgi:hypothetical protein
MALSIPDVVDVGAGCQFLTQNLGLVVGVAIGGRLAFMILRIVLKDLKRSRWEGRHKRLVESADLADDYDLDDADQRREAARTYYFKGHPRRRSRRRQDW